MSTSWPGGIISATPLTTVGGEEGSASGMWTIAEVADKVKNATWPLIGGINLGSITTISIDYSDCRVEKLTNSTFIQVYDDGTNFKARILTRVPDSFSITKGSATTLGSNTSGGDVKKILVFSSTLAVAIFGTTNSLWGVVLSISGTTITAGSITQLFGVDTVAYDLFGAAILDSTKFIMVGNNGWTQQIVVKAIGISGTSLSVLASKGGSGNAILEANPGYGYTGYAESGCVCSIDSSNVGFIVRTNAAGRLVVFNYSGGSLTVAQNTTFNGGYPLHNGIVMLSSTKGWITWNGYGDNVGSQSGPLYMRPITFNGSTFSMGSTITWNNNSPIVYRHTTDYGVPLVKISSTKMGYGIPLNSAGNYVKHYIIEPNASSTSLTTGTVSDPDGWYGDGQIGGQHGALDAKTYWAQKANYLYLAPRT